MSREDQAADERDEWEGEELYEIKVAGTLDQHWQRRFEGMTLENGQNADDGMPCAVITGAVRDQPALHGLLSLIRDLNLTLLSVSRVAAESPSEREDDPDHEC